MGFVLTLDAFCPSRWEFDGFDEEFHQQARRGEFRGFLPLALGSRHVCPLDQRSLVGELHGRQLQ